LDVHLQDRWWPRHGEHWRIGWALSREWLAYGIEGYDDRNNATPAYPSQESLYPL
jgi:hypothetical protein